MLPHQPDEYRTVYDITSAGRLWIDGGFLWTAAILGIAALLNGFFGRDRMRNGVGFVGAVLLLIMVTAVSLSISGDQKAMIEALRTGRYSIVERDVTDFQPGQATGHPPERFTVRGHHYHISPGWPIVGFHQMSVEGGPLRNGLRVRIAEVDERIARLEIKP